MAGGFEYRAVMLDMVRLPERHEYYRSLLPHFKRWGFNVLHLHFNDDPGCALAFPSHPELATEHAYSVDEMKAFCDEARRHDLEVLPELESFGHTDFITDVEQYSHLREVDETGGRFRGICVFEQETQDLLADLVRDTVEVFGPKIIHAGLDEVNFGWHPTTKKLLANHKKNELFAGHVRWMHGVIASHGCRMAMWGDHPQSDEERVIVAQIPKDTIIFDHRYGPDYTPETSDFYLDRGYELWGSTSIQRYRNAVISSWENFENLRRFTGYGLQRRDGAAGRGRFNGIDVTIWCPYRYVPGTIEYPLALAGYLCSHDELEPEDFAEDFAASFFGVKGAMARRLGRALEDLYGVSPIREEHHRYIWGFSAGNPQETFTRADQHVCRDRLKRAREADAALKSALSEATQNTDRLLDLLTASKYLVEMYGFAAAGWQGSPDWKGVQKAMQESYRRTRFCDDRHYAGRSDSPPAERDYDDIMPQINRLADDSQ